MSKRHVPSAVVALAAIGAVGGLRVDNVDASSRRDARHDAPNGAPNGAPVGVDDAFEVVQDTRLVVGAPGVLANDVDPDGDPILNGFHSAPAHGSITMPQNGSFEYIPDPGFVGVDVIRYSVQDDHGNFTGLVPTITITVTAAPDPTTSAPGEVATTVESTVTTTVETVEPSDPVATTTAPAGPEVPTVEAPTAATAPTTTTATPDGTARASGSAVTADPAPTDRPAGIGAAPAAEAAPVLPATGSALRLAIVALVLVLLGAISLGIAGKRRST